MHIFVFHKCPIVSPCLVYLRIKIFVLHIVISQLSFFNQYLFSRLPESKDKATSESLIKNGAKDNPCYTLDSGTSIDETVKDSAHAMDTRNDKLENEGKRNGK